MDEAYQISSEEFDQNEQFELLYSFYRHHLILNLFKWSPHMLDNNKHYNFVMLLYLFAYNQKLNLSISTIFMKLLHFPLIDEVVKQKNKGY
jgi:hypothetical protein